MVRAVSAPTIGMDPSRRVEEERIQDFSEIFGEMMSYKFGGYSSHKMGKPKIKEFSSPLQSGGRRYNQSFKKDWMYPSSKPINFDEVKEKFDLMEINSRVIGSNFDPEVLDELGLPNNIDYEIRRFIIALNLWEKTPGKKLYEKETIFSKSLLEGPSFTSQLKDEWEFGIRASHCFPVMGRNYKKWREVEHYSALPTIEHLIHWEVIPDDYKYMFEKLNDYDSELLDEFEEIIEELIPNDLFFPEDWEVLSEVKTSSSFSLVEKRKIPFYQARSGPQGNDFSSYFKAIRTIVPVAAGNVRDTVVATIDTYNSVKWIDLLIARVIDGIDSSVPNSSSRKYNSKLRRASKSDRRYLYYLRDIKKCGLTFPRELFHIIEEVLCRKYPNEERLKRFSIYRSYDLYYENGKPFEKEPNRGFCLGMANNLVTLCQCAIFEMIKRKLPEDLEIYGSFGNDDSVIKVKINDWTTIEETASLIEMVDSHICEGLNVMKHIDKSFWSFYPIFFEEYGKEEFKEKASRLAMALSLAYVSPNITYAKLVVNALSPLMLGRDWERNILNDIIYHWGYEFFPREQEFSYRLGGWITFRSRGCDPILREIFKLDDDEIIPAFQSIKQKEVLNKQFVRVRKSENTDKNVSVLGRRYGVRYLEEDIELPSRINSSLLMMDAKEFNRYFHGIFEFSRRPFKYISQAVAATRKMSIQKDSVSKHDLLMYVFERNTNNLCIPQEVVIGETHLMDLIEKDINLPQKYKYNSVARYLEHLRREGKIYSDEPFAKYSQSSLTEVSDIDLWDPHDRDYEEPKMIKKISGENFSSALSFGPNPYIILWEYYKEYDICPVEVSSSFHKKKVTNLKLWEIEPQTEQEVALVYLLIDQLDTIDILIVLEELRANIQHEEDTKNSSDKEEFYICKPHQIDLRIGQDDSFNIFKVIEEDCFICSNLELLDLNKIKSVHCEDHLERIEAQSARLLIVDRLFNFLKDRYDIEDIAAVMDVPSSAVDDEASEGEFNLFGSDISDD